MAFGEPTRAPITKFANAPVKQQPYRQRQQNREFPPSRPWNFDGQTCRQEQDLARKEGSARPDFRNRAETQNNSGFQRFGPTRGRQARLQDNGIQRDYDSRNQGPSTSLTRSSRPRGWEENQSTFHSDPPTQETFSLQDPSTTPHFRHPPRDAVEGALLSQERLPAQARNPDEVTGNFDLASTSRLADLGICDYNWLNNWTRLVASTWNGQSDFQLRSDQIEDTIAEAHELLISEDLLGRRVIEVLDDLKAWLGEKFSYQRISDPALDCATRSMPTPSVPGAQLGQFLVLVNGFIQHKNEDGLSNCVRIEPPFLNEYAVMINELHQLYPKGSESALEDECRRVLSAAREGVDGSGTWTPFILFMLQYLVYLRDYEDGTEHILETFDRLSLLQKRANSALNHTLGYLMLHIVVTSAKFVSYLAITLDKNPQMVRNRNKASTQDEGSQAESLAEGAVNNLRDAFNTCATDRLAHVDSNGKPDGRKRGIYLIANICLKILFQCRKTNNATTFFDSIDTHSPPLSAYPKAQRVTYLYYLGRFHFQHSHFYRAYLALQQAHSESPTNGTCISQRRQILVYLMASSIICGRLPSDTLFQHLPEAQGMYEHFAPLLSAIRSGNLAGFRRAMDFNSPHAAFFLKHRIFLQLRNRCEVLVWRSLVRRTWILTGTRFDATAGSNAPLIEGHNLVNAFYVLEKQVQDPAEATHISSDFHGADIEEDAEALLPNTTSVRSIVSSLIEQGLIRGWFVAKSGKFVITGVKSYNGSELAAGFPAPWAVISNKADKNVPGWKRDDGGGHGGRGKVIHLTSARAVGS